MVIETEVEAAGHVLLVVDTIGVEGWHTNSQSPRDSRHGILPVGELLIR